MKNKVKTAVVGLGGRGFGLLDALLVTMDNVEITAVCDLYPDRLQAGVDSVVRAYGEDHRPFATTDYRDFFGRDDIEAILVLCAWEAHFPIAIDAMEHGIPVAMEVGGAYTIDDCWRLVRTYEKTKTPSCSWRTAATARQKCWS
ncbi:MAG: Gfo/Idh/MocA family oxidoreductase [Clostridia bacterium]|nr:Gfo/Idh/MocA family oxidoreductase [Clostridia bacterium]